MAEESRRVRMVFCWLICLCLVKYFWQGRTVLLYPVPSPASVGDNPGGRERGRMVCGILSVLDVNFNQRL
jgi:hypothetical protein